MGKHEVAATVVGPLDEDIDLVPFANPDISIDIPEFRQAGIMPSDL